MYECHKGSVRGRPVAASQSRAVWSKLAVRTVLPSGLKATAITWSRCCMVLPIAPAGRGVPEPGGVVVAAGQDGLAVGAEGHRIDESIVLHGLADRLLRDDVPEPRGLIPAPGQDRLAIGAPRHGMDTLVQGLAQVFPRGNVPELGEAGMAQSQGRLAVGAEHHGPDRGLVLPGVAQGLAVGVPEPRRVVPAAGQHRPAIGAKGHGQDLGLVLEDGAEGMDLMAPAVQAQPQEPLKVVGAGRGELQPAGQPEQAVVGVALLAEAQSPVEGQAGRPPLGFPALVIGDAPRRHRLVPLCPRLPPLPDDAGKTGRGHQQEHRDKGRDRRLAPGPLGNALGNIGAAGEDGIAMEEAIQILRQGVGRAVAPLRVLVQTFQADRLQVAIHVAVNLARGARAGARAPAGGCP